MVVIDDYPVEINLPDGEHKVFIKETSWNSIDEIPEQFGVVNSIEPNYPDFTLQSLEGTLTIEDGRVDNDELEDLFPDDWGEFNSHRYFEGIESDGRIILGS